MTTETTLPLEDDDARLLDIDDEDEDDEDDWIEDEPELVPDAKWEDWLAAMNLKKQHPEYILLKVSNYSPQKFIDIEEWAKEVCIDRWKKIDWRGACSYTVIMAFKSDVDAVHYQLRWN